MNVSGSRTISTSGAYHMKTSIAKDKTVRHSTLVKEELELLPTMSGTSVVDSTATYTWAMPKYSSTLIVSKGKIIADCSEEASRILEKTIVQKLVDLQRYLRSKMRIISDAVELELAITLDATGKVLSVSITGDEILKKNERLIIHKVKEWKFEGLGLKKPLVVQIPVTLSP